MVDTVKSELFFELVYALSGLSGENEILRKGLPMYLRKLGCFAACVMKQENHTHKVHFVRPNVLKSHEQWTQVVALSQQQEAQHPGLFDEVVYQNQYFYLYKMDQYGLLVLGRDRPLPLHFALELIPIINFWGKSLNHALEQERRQQAEMLNRHIMDAALDAIVIVDENGIITYWNPAAERIFGWAAPEIEGKIVSEMIVPVYLREAHAEQMERFRSGESRLLNRIIEMPGLHRDGHEVPVELSVIPLNQNGRFYFCGFIKDISIRKAKDEIIGQQIDLQNLLIKISSTYINIDLERVEEAIQGSLEDLGRFIGADRTYIFEYNFSHQTASKTFEWCAEGISPTIQCTQAIPMEVLATWIDAHQKGQPFSIADISAIPEGENEFLRKTLVRNGLKSLITLPMLGHKGLIGFIGFDSIEHQYIYTDKEMKLLTVFAQMLINVFERRQKDRELRNQEEKYRNIITNMNLGLLEVDKDDTILFANQSFCDISGYAPEDLIGKKSATLLFNPEDAEILKNKGHLREQGISDSYEFLVKNKKGEELWWFVSGAPNYNDNGEHIGSIGIHLDITQQKKMEKDLAVAKTRAEDASKAKEAFLANMSHEIRTPLNAIIGMIRELGREALTPKQQLYLSHSETAAQHLLTILNNILDISKIEAGEFNLDLHELSLSAIISNVKSILQSRASDKGLKLNVLVSPDIAPCHIGDGTRIRQILINLIGNAIKFTEQGKVSLLAEVEHEQDCQQVLKFTIQDTGVGMSKEFLGRLFSKFAQEEDKSNRRFDGTGLGLAITQEMVQLMNGQISVDSTKHQGTTIEVTLPLKIGDPSKLYNGSEQRKTDSLKGVKVLLVEDNDMNRYIATKSLQYVDCEVIEAVNGKDAIEKLRQQTVDVVLMDIQMPEMDGVEATKFIRAHLSPSLPIIALTANAFKKDIEHYLASGMNDYVTKPFEESMLFMAIARHVQAAKTNGTASTNKLYSLAKLKDISRGDTLFLHKMVGIFIEQTPSTIHDMQKSLANREWDKVSKLAHRLKPSIDNLEITPLQSIIRDLESASKSAQPNMNRLAALLQKTQEVTAAVIVQLQEEFKASLE